MPSYAIVTAELATKPEPETVTCVPTGPEVGLNVVDGVTVKSALAVFPRLPVAVTVCAPPADDGILNVALKLPD